MLLFIIQLINLNFLRQTCNFIRHMKHAKRLILQNEDIIERIQKAPVKDQPWSPIKKQRKVTFGDQPFPHPIITKSPKPNSNTQPRFQTEPLHIKNPTTTNFFSNFKSLLHSQSPTPPPLLTQPLQTYYHHLNTPLPTTTSPTVSSILSIRKSPTLRPFTSRFGLSPPKDFITKPGLYSIKYSNRFQQQSCGAIVDELGRDFRRRLKGNYQGEDNRQMIIDLKQIGFGDYAEVVLERTKRILIDSVVSNFGSVQLKEGSLKEVILDGGKYEVKEKKKKDVRSVEINTDQSRLKPQPILVLFQRSWDTIKLDIQKEKLNKGRIKPEEYQHRMDEKLQELLNYILQGQPTYRNLDYPQKVKLLLTEIDRFKGRSIDGETKINIILYLFRESKDLKDYIDRQRAKEKEKSWLNPIPPLPTIQAKKLKQKPNVKSHAPLPAPDKRPTTDRKAYSQKGPVP